jgi:large subunit ribosomal protein L9e
MIGDVTCAKSTDGTKDELVIQGNCLDAVSQSAANIQQISKIKDKDIRKFLDGVYVSYKGNIVQDD